jgi:glucose-6-phosphate isomerase
MVGSELALVLPSRIMSAEGEQHEVFVQGTVWQIDSFDQWGVEPGKVLAQRIVPELESKAEPKRTHDSSSNSLIARYRNDRRGN